jgi:hypothetical protein
VNRPAEHPEHGVLLGDPQIAPQRQLQTAGDRVTADRGNHGFAQHHSGGVTTAFLDNSRVSEQL